MYDNVMHTLYSHVLLHVMHYCTVALCHCLLFLDLAHCLYVQYAIQPSLGCNHRHLKMSMVAINGFLFYSIQRVV